MSGYDDYRRLNDATNRQNEERNRQQAAERQRQLERDQDRQTAARRHRERLAAQRGHGLPANSPNGGKLRRSAFLFVGTGLALFVIPYFLAGSLNTPSSESRPANEVLPSPVVAVESEKTGSQLADPPTQVEAPAFPDTSADRADLSESAKMSALISGGSQTYEAFDGLHVITVSVPVSLGDRTCRTVVDTANATATADTQTWCSSASSNWKRAS